MKTSSKKRDVISRINRGKELFSKRLVLKENGKVKKVLTSREGIGIIKTVYGNFWYFNFHLSDKWKNYSVLVRAQKLDGNLNPIFKNKTKIILRIDSGCDTGQIFEDLTCDCKKQLQKAMNIISKAGEGIIIRINGQDGRGMGLPFKLATLWLQDELKFDTVNAAKIIADKNLIEKRTYSGIIAILKFLNISSKTTITLLTNNPHKIRSLINGGYSTVKQSSLKIHPTKNTKRHLEAKKNYFKNI